MNVKMIQMENSTDVDVELDSNCLKIKDLVNQWILVSIIREAVNITAQIIMEEHNVNAILVFICLMTGGLVLTLTNVPKTMDVSISVRMSKEHTDVNVEKVINLEETEELVRKCLEDVKLEMVDANMIVMINRMAGTFASVEMDIFLQTIRSFVMISTNVMRIMGTVHRFVSIWQVLWNVNVSLDLG